MSLSPDQNFIAKQFNVLPSALPDIELQFEENGADASFSEWLESQRSAKPHWFTLAADDRLEILYSLKAQADAVRRDGEDQVRAILKANGLALGQIRKRPPADAAKPAPNNVFSDAFRGTDAERQAKIASMIKAMGAAKVAAIAASAGRRIDGTLLPKK